MSTDRQTANLMLGRMRTRLETKISWCFKCAKGFVCFVLSVRSALAGLLILFVIIIKRQNKFFVDVMVVICRNLQEVVSLHDSGVRLVKVEL
jgi:hypothetical protein